MCFLPKRGLTNESSQTANSTSHLPEALVGGVADHLTTPFLSPPPSVPCPVGYWVLLSLQEKSHSYLGHSFQLTLCLSQFRPSTILHDCEHLLIGLLATSPALRPTSPQHCCPIYLPTRASVVSPCLHLKSPHFSIGYKFLGMM